jgi:hypothetical protein
MQQMHSPETYSRIRQDKENSNYLLFKNNNELHGKVLTKVTFTHEKDSTLISNIVVRHNNKEYRL